MSRLHASAIDRLAVIVASFGMSGFFPVAPATFASAVTALLLAFVYPLASAIAYAVLLAVLLLLGVWASGRMERLYGRDPSAAVIDEVLGMALTMVGAPVGPVTLLFGFIFFRFFDILKVPPGRLLERLPGGWGVMMDDVMAGAYAALSLQLVLRVWPEPRLETWHLGVLVGAGALLFAFRRPLVERYGKKRSHIGTAFGNRESG